MEPIFFKTSPLLREAAELKIRELDQAKQTFKDRYIKSAKHLDRAGTLGRLSALLESFATLDSHLEDEDELSTIARYVEQAKDDLSISADKLLNFEKQLQQKISEYTNRLEVSSLHAELLRKAVAEDKSISTIAHESTRTVMDDDFEIVQNDAQYLISNFEKQASKANNVDVEALEQYLADLMEVDGNTDALNVLRTGLGYGSQATEASLTIEQEELMWGMFELLKSDRITKQRKITFENYLQSPMALRELLSTLKVKLIRDWDWHDPERGVPISVRQNSDQDYYVAIDEDIIDMLFLNAVATGWATELRENLEVFVQSVKPALKRVLTQEELETRAQFLTDSKIGPAPPSLPNPVNSRGKKKSKTRLLPPRSESPPLPLFFLSTSDTLDEERQNNFIQNFFMSRLPIQDGGVSKSKRPEEVEACLIKTLAAEIKLREAFDGEVYTSVHTFFSSASTLSHEAVLTVSKFLGVPDTAINFFARFLRAKLYSNPDRVLTRAAGVPSGHAMEMLFMEAIYFFLDFAVWKKTCVFLYRIRHDCYFVGTAQQGSQVEEEIARFSRVFGLKSSLHHGPLRIGHLHLISDKKSLRSSTFQISYLGLDFYARRLKQRLDACTSIIEWIRTWNSTVGTYAAHLFGPLATVLGASHRTAVIDAYKRIFAIVFPGSNLTAHVTSMLRSHLSLPLDDPPYALEALIYLPSAYGGLGVKNPFTTFSLAAYPVANPDGDIDYYLELERDYYAAAALSLGHAQPPNKDFIEQAELMKHREIISFRCPSRVQNPALAQVYKSLLQEPKTLVDLGRRVTDELARLQGRGHMKSEAKLSGEDLWVLRLYASEFFERYGGLEVWCPEMVPREAMRGLRGDMWDDEDDSGWSSSDDSEFSDV